MIKLLMLLGEILLFITYSAILLHSTLMGNADYYNLWFAVYLYLLLVLVVFNNYLIEFRDWEIAEAHMAFAINLIYDRYDVTKKPQQEV